MLYARPRIRPRALIFFFRHVFEAENAHYVLSLHAVNVIGPMDNFKADSWSNRAFALITTRRLPVCKSVKREGGKLRVILFAGSPMRGMIWTNHDSASWNSQTPFTREQATVQWSTARYIRT